jgi:hypothetical protein
LFVLSDFFKTFYVSFGFQMCNNLLRLLSRISSQWYALVFGHLLVLGGVKKGKGN